MPKQFPRPVGTKRKPTPQERQAATRLAVALRKVTYPSRAKTKVAVDAPPGRVKVRQAAAAQAQRNARTEVTAKPFVTVKRAKTIHTQMRVGIACDISGSMRPAEEPLADGLVGRIGEEVGRITHNAAGHREVFDEPVPDHATAFARVHALLDGSEAMLSAGPLTAVGHRVVHGGAAFSEPVVVDDGVLAGIESVIPLAPLHNPANLLGIRAATAAYPDAPHVAVFDTAFHTTMPASAYTYAIDPVVAQQHQLRRYAFHGTSHKYVARATADHLGISLERLDMVSLHLGNGASACAIAGGRSIDTSMGVGPLEGLVMGTRSGDIDPTVIFTLLKSGMSADEVDALLNRGSGVRGMCGDNDLRVVQARADAGDEAAELARQVYVHGMK